MRVPGTVRFRAMEIPSPPDVVYAWRPEPRAALRRKVRWAALVLALVVMGAVGVAVLSPARWTVVVALLLGGIGVLWWLEHRRLFSTRVTVDADGTLEVRDARSTHRIVLATVDSVAVRLRTATGQAALSPNTRWTIEVLGPDASLRHELALVGGLFHLDEEDLHSLEAGLCDAARRSGASLDGAPASDRGAPSRGEAPGEAGHEAVAERAPAGVGAGASSGDPFTWSPPVSPAADRRRRRLRIGYIAFALVVAVLGARSAWEEGPTAILLSALTVPGLILLLCGGIDYAAGRARRFRLTVESGILQVHGGGAAAAIPLTGATVAVERRANLVSTGSRTIRTTHWQLEIEASDGQRLVRALPAVGTSTTAEDYMALERELRRRT